MPSSDAQPFPGGDTSAVTLHNVPAEAVCVFECVPVFVKKIEK